MLIDEKLAAEAIGEALKRGGDFAEIYVERRHSVGLSLEDGRLEHSTTGFDSGASVRVTKGRNTSFVSTDSLDEESVIKAARLAGEGLAPGGGAPQALALEKIRSPHVIEIPPDTVATKEKAALLHAADGAARGAGAEIIQAQIIYGDDFSEVLIANSEGALATEERTRVRIIARSVGSRDGIMQTGYESVGAHKGMEVLGGDAAAEVGRISAEKALRMLDSKPAPSGKMTVVMHRGFGGVLFHEACGHGLEADSVEKGTSVFAGKIGEKVAADMVTLIDDGSLPGEWGSNAFDDEGTPTQRTVLIEQGRLAGFMYDGLRARNAGVKSTGNGRRQSFRHTPIPRMTNTFILSGPNSRDEIIESTQRGFYAKTLSGGQVDTVSGDFVFGVSEGYLIENGRVTSPLRGATLIGNGLVALLNIDMIADDFEMNVGLCGKEGQNVPAGSGQPTLRIQNMTVGGTEV